MGESNRIDIAAILLVFGTLDEKRRKQFMDRLNEFMYVSTQQQRKLMETWRENCLDCDNPALNMVAESMAIYDAHGHKPRKKRCRKRSGGKG